MLSPVLRLQWVAGGRDISPNLVTLGSTLPPALGVVERGQAKGDFPQAIPPSGRGGVVLVLPCSHSQGWLTCAIISKVLSAVLP